MTMHSALAGLAAVATMMPVAAGAQTMAIPVQAIAGTQLDIVAEGKTTRVPDIATVSAGVVSQATDAAGAMRDNAQRMTRVIAALKQAGIAERDIQTASIALNPQYRYQDGKAPVITGYQASNTVSVRFRDIDKAGAILDTLVAQGANQIDGPNLSIDKPAAALDEARLDAMKTARARAELYAQAAGLKVKRIISISEQQEMGRPMPMPVMRMQAADAVAESKIAAGEQSVGVTLSVRFELQ